MAASAVSPWRLTVTVVAPPSVTGFGVAVPATKTELETAMSSTVPANAATRVAAPVARFTVYSA